jgi:hypothetical protein
MRYWDGAKWTDATGPMPRPRQPEPSVPDPAMAGAVPGPAAAGYPTSSWPAAPVPPPPGPQFTGAPGPFQPAAPAGFGYQSTRAPLPGWGAPTKPARSSKAKLGIAAAVAVVVAAGAVSVPTVFLHSSKTALTKSFQKALLTPDQVSTVTDETFVVDTSNDDTSDDDSTAGCMDPMNGLTNGNARGDASTSLKSADEASFMVEELSSNTNSAQQISLLRNTLQTCHTATIGGLNVDLQLLSQPAVSGSNDTLAFRFTTHAPGRTVAFDFYLARFGDTVVTVAYGSLDTSVDLEGRSSDLLNAAVLNARSAIPQHSA